MGPVVWLIAAVTLAGLELMAGDFTLLMLAGGALAAAGVGFAGLPLWATGATFCIVSILLVFFVRPVMRRQLTSRQALDTSAKALEGSHATVLETTSATGVQIRLCGSIWTAKSMDPQQVFEPEETVQVLKIDGATAIVWKTT